MASNSRLVPLRLRNDFLKLQKQGRQIRPTGWLIISYRKNQLGQLRYGATFPSYVGTAVVRNRLKRWYREHLRHLVKRNDCSLDVNIVLRRQAKDFFKQMSHQEFVSVLSKAESNACG